MNIFNLKLFPRKLLLGYYDNLLGDGVYICYFKMKA